MKNLIAGAFILACLVFTVDGFYYHVFEELGQARQGDVIIQQDAGTISGRDQMTQWSENTVPYVVSSEFTSKQIKTITMAMEEIENVSCVRFVPKEAKHSNFVQITAEGSGCWAALGMHGGEQQMNLDPRGCITQGSIMHQLMHVLGFGHPSSRPDRDLYVEIRFDHVIKSELHQFVITEINGHNDFGMTYDYDSILQRSAMAFSATGEETIVPLHEDIELGQRDTLSLKDIRKLNKLYICNPR